jgi:hypothetical protein
MGEFRMARQTKREYLRLIHERYRRAGRAEKTAMLEEFCKVCGYNRKYAIWLLQRPLSQPGTHTRRTERSVTYSKAAITTLAKVWEASGYLCSQRLKAALPQWLPWIKKHFALDTKLAKELLAISARQMDRRLFPHKRTVKRRLYGTTRPGSLLKQMIPVKTDHWDVTLAGYLEIDLVSHSGPSAAGEFIYTLDCVDIATGWVERQAVMGKGQLGIIAALSDIDPSLYVARQKIFQDDQGLLDLKLNAHQSATSSSRVKPFFSPSLCARSSNCQKSFRCASNMLSRSVSSVTGKSTAQGRPFFVITTDFSDGNSLTILLSLALTSRRLSIFIIRTSFHLSTTRCLFCARPAPR